MTLGEYRISAYWVALGSDSVYKGRKMAGILFRRSRRGWIVTGTLPAEGGFIVNLS